MMLKPAEQHTIITNTLLPNPPAHTTSSPRTQGASWPYVLPHGLRGIPAQLYAYHEIWASFSYEYQLYGTQLETVFIFLALTGQQ